MTDSLYPKPLANYTCYGVVEGPMVVNGHDPDGSFIYFRKDDLPLLVGRINTFMKET
jgi:hypothetical protein